MVHLISEQVSNYVQQYVSSMLHNYLCNYLDLTVHHFRTVQGYLMISNLMCQFYQLLEVCSEFSEAEILLFVACLK